MWCFQVCHVFLDVLGIHTCLRPRPWTSPKPLIVVPSNWTRSKIPETILFLHKGYIPQIIFLGYSRMGPFFKRRQTWFPMIYINPFFLPKTHTPSCWKNERKIPSISDRWIPGLRRFRIQGPKAHQAVALKLGASKRTYGKSSGKCWGKQVKSWKHMKSLKSASCCFGCMRWDSFAFWKLKPLRPRPLKIHMSLIP